MPTLRALSSLYFLVSALVAQDFRELGTGGLVPTSERDWRAVAVGDLDGDGDIDQMFACFGPPGIGQRNFWVRNDGSGVFTATPANFVQLAPSLSNAVLLADFDGDGDLDAFFGNQRFDALCRNDGTGHFVLDPTALPALDRATNAAVAVDIDGDGDLDIVAACGGFDIVYRNDGTGTFTDGSDRLPVDWKDSRDLDLGDFDGDGDLDLVVVNFDGDSRLLWNDGTGHFTQASATFGRGSWITGGDIDGDGDRDFVLGTFSTFPAVRYCILYRNQGNGTWLTQGIGSSSYDEGRGRLVDVDGDGDLDFALAKDQVYENVGNGSFAFGPLQPALGSHFADIDGDGDLDQVGEPTLQNDGTGTFVWPRPVAVLPAEQGGPVALLDFDRDGRLDIVHVTFSFQTFTNVLTVLGGDGRGVFRSVLVQAMSESLTGRPWLVCDLDGDGFEDLMQRSGGVWYRNVAGAGASQQALPQAIHEALPFDADGDGDLDLVGRSGAGTPLWLRNTGGTFTTAATILPSSISSILGVGDCDGDGRDDVLWSVPYAPGARLQRVTGNGVFTELANAFPAGLPAVGVAAIADLDGDGDLDVALGHDGFGPRLSVLANDGTGQFTLAAQYSLGSQYARSIQAADLDGDGDQDLFVRSGVNEASRLLRNEGGLVFVEATGNGGDWRGLTVPLGADVLVADLDRDGDLDVVPFGTTTTQVLHNLQRQLVARSEPVRGGEWRLEVLQRPVGPSLGSVLLGLAEADPAVPTPFGDLRIDPAGLVMEGLAVVDTFAPVEVLAVPVPNAPSIVGIAVFAQHVTHDGVTIRLGNQIVGVVQ